MRVKLHQKIRALKDLPAPAERLALRQRAGVSQEDLARAVDVTGQTVSNWERGLRTPEGENLLRYVKVLDLLREESTA